MGGTWVIPNANYENIGYAILTTLILSTLDNWIYIMYYCFDGNSSLYVNK